VRRPMGGDHAVLDEKPARHEYSPSLTPVKAARTVAEKRSPR
jgi:hypothetical protein